MNLCVGEVEGGRKQFQFGAMIGKRCDKKGRGSPRTVVIDAQFCLDVGKKIVGNAAANAPAPPQAEQWAQDWSMRSSPRDCCRT